MEKKSRMHRVGSITAGISMIVYGVLFLFHLFTRLISYEMIFRLWPLMIVGLGVEILLSNRSEDKFVYDKAAIFLQILMTLFALCMAGADVLITECIPYIRFYAG